MRVLLFTLIGLFWLVSSAGADATPALLNPIERIAYSDDWRQQVTRTVQDGGSVFVVARIGSNACTSFKVSAQDAKRYVMLPTTIDIPSGRGGRTGAFYEALVPLNPISCQLSSYVLIDWRPQKTGMIEIQIDNTILIVDVHVTKPKTKTPRPFFVGITNNHLLRAHCGGYCRREGELGSAYGSLLTAHGIQPIQGWARLPPIRDGRLDLDAGKERGMSFRQLVMNVAISDRVGFPRAHHYKDKVAYLRALETTILAEGLQGHAWVYAVDEPRVSDALIDRLKPYRLFAPNVKIMVTTPYDRRLSPYIDIFAPVYNQVVTGKAEPARNSASEFWSYPSCMGSCGPRRQSNKPMQRKPGPDTGLTDFLIDRPATRLFQFFKDADALKLDAGLYYEATEPFRLIPSGMNLIQDPWNYGGNGDGLLIYPGRKGEYGLIKDQPLPSYRLKLIRYALQKWWGVFSN